LLQASRYLLHGTIEHHALTRRAGQPAAHQHEALLGAHLHDLQVLDRAPCRAHVAVHALAAENAAGERTVAYRPGPAERLVRAARRRLALEAVATHDTLVALALRSAVDVDLVARLEDVADLQLLADLVRGHVLYVELEQADEVAASGFRHVRFARLVHETLALRPEADLDGVVSVGVARAHLNDRARRGFDDGDGYELAVGPEDLRHAELLSNESRHRDSRLSAA
jgi:hypothetical protein